MAVQISRRRFSAHEYHQMARAGILNEDERVELIEGEIVQMAPIGDSHAGGVNRLARLFMNLFRDVTVAVVAIQNPIRLSEYSEPQPDIALLRPRPDYYSSAGPTSEDCLLLIEVAESSASVDRRVKMPLYARHGVAEVWLVDLPRQTITVYRDPSRDGYRTTHTVLRGGRLSPLHFPDIEISADDILGPPQGPVE